MEKEFNLSEKRNVFKDFVLYEEKDVKEFIKKLKAKQDWEGMIHIKEIDKLAGKDLI